MPSTVSVRFAGRFLCDAWTHPFRSEESRERFRTTFFPLLPISYLSAVVAFELRVDALGRRTRDLVLEFIRPMERTGRVVPPTFADWLDAAEVITEIHEKRPSLRSKLPALLNDALIAITARRIGATVLTHNVADFRLLREHREFALRILDA